MKEVRALIDFLKQRVNDLDDVRFVGGAVNQSPAPQNEDRQSKGSSKVRKPKHQPNTVTGASDPSQEHHAEQNSSRQRRKHPPRQCLFCSSTEHGASRCSADLSLEQKKGILARLKRCVRCLRPEHSRAGECQGRYTLVTNADRRISTPLCSRVLQALRCWIR